MNLTITVEGEEKLSRALTGVVRDVEDLRPSWRAVSDEVYSITRAQFLKAPWPKRAESTLHGITLLNRKGASVTGEPLRRTDRMFTALTTRNAPHGVYEETKDSLTLGVGGLAYPVLHQKGTSRMPQRKIYDFSEKDTGRIMTILKRGLVKKIRDRGFDFVGGGDAIPF